MSSTTIHVGDALAVLKTLPSESVQCIVTSPPYYGLRDYGTATWEGGDEGCDHKPLHRAEDGSEAGSSTLGGGKAHIAAQELGVNAYRDTCGKCGATRIDDQLGLEPTPDEYVARLVAVFAEARRVLRDDGVLWLNLGDSYANNGVSDPSKVGGFTGDRIRAGVKGIMDSRPRSIPTGLKPKDLIGIPWRVAFALQADGADLRAMAALERYRERLLDAYDGETIPDKVLYVLDDIQAEYVAAKGAGWWLRSDCIWHKPNPMPESVTDRPTKAHEYVFLLSKSARYFYDADAVAEDALSPEREREKGNGESAVDTKMRGYGSHCGTYGATRNRRTVWTITPQPYSGAHFATMPPDLVEVCVKAGSAPGDTILDPFGGAGTTGLVANRLDRDAVLIELNADYAEMARERIYGDAPMFANVEVV